MFLCILHMGMGNTKVLHNTIWYLLSPYKRKEFEVQDSTLLSMLNSSVADSIMLSIRNMPQGYRNILS